MLNHPLRGRCFVRHRGKARLGALCGRIDEVVQTNSADVGDVARVTVFDWESGEEFADLLIAIKDLATRPDENGGKWILFFSHSGEMHDYRKEWVEEQREHEEWLEKTGGKAQ